VEFAFNRFSKLKVYLVFENNSSTMLQKQKIELFLQHYCTILNYLSLIIVSQLAMLKSDLIGILNATLCLAHCIAVPVLLTVQPTFLSGFFGENLFFLDYIFLMIGGIAVVVSAYRTSFVHIKVLFCSIYLLFVVCIVCENLSFWFRYVSYVSSVALILLHIYNVQKTRQFSQTQTPCNV
jgi:hypothetical protein